MIDLSVLWDTIQGHLQLKKIVSASVDYSSIDFVTPLDSSSSETGFIITLAKLNTCIDFDYRIHLITDIDAHSGSLCITNLSLPIKITLDNNYEDGSWNISAEAQDAYIENISIDFNENSLFKPLTIAWN
jgi:hypothetical protein